MNFVFNGRPLCKTGFDELNCIQEHWYSRKVWSLLLSFLFEPFRHLDSVFLVYGGRKESQGGFKCLLLCENQAEKSECSFESAFSLIIIGFLICFRSIHVHETMLFQRDLWCMFLDVLLQDFFFFFFFPLYKYEAWKKALHSASAFLSPIHERLMWCVMVYFLGVVSSESIEPGKITE